MNAKQFLQIGGAALIALGILGYIGVLGPTADKSIFGTTWWFDNQENIAHLVLGIIGIGASVSLKSQTQKMLVMAFGAVGVLVGLYSLALSETLLGASLQNPADSILHLVVGGWALWAVMAKK